MGVQAGNGLIVREIIRRNAYKPLSWLLGFLISLLVVVLLNPAHGPNVGAQPQGNERAGEADIVYTNAQIWTGDTLHSRAEALAIRDGKFLAVGTEEDIKAVSGPDTQTVNLRGQMVMPGIIDSHIHAVRGGLAHLYFCNFPVTATVEDIQNKVKECASTADEGAWDRGQNLGFVAGQDLNRQDA